MQELADGLNATRIEMFRQKWQRRLPSPFPGEQRTQYRYDVSMSQIEFALRQVPDRPVHGRIFFEEVIRENLDLGRPDNLQWIFERRVTKRTPGRFRTRVVDEQRASALRFGDPTVLALFSVWLVFRLLPCGFRSRDLREHLAPLLGDDPSQWPQGRLTYQLRRLRLHGLIEREGGTQRYHVTPRGQRVALWFSHCHARLFRPAPGELLPDELSKDASLRHALETFDRHLERYLERVKLRPAAENPWLAALGRTRSENLTQIR